MKRLLSTHQVESAAGKGKLERDLKQCRSDLQSGKQQLDNLRLQLIHSQKTAAGLQGALRLAEQKSSDSESQLSVKVRNQLSVKLRGRGCLGVLSIYLSLSHTHTGDTADCSETSTTGVAGVTLGDSFPLGAAGSHAAQGGGPGGRAAGNETRRALPHSGTGQYLPHPITHSPLPSQPHTITPSQPLPTHPLTLSHYVLQENMPKRELLVYLVSSS